MAGENNSANMSLPIPGVGITTGPVYATDVNNCLTIIDGHTHAAGSGVQITPAGLNINSDLTFNSNNATNLRSVRLVPQVAPLAQPADLGILYEVADDLYYNDGIGNQIRITQSGSVAGASGTITGLPSGTASASYNSGGATFIFQSASSTAATMDVGSVIIRNLTASANGVTIQAPAALGSNYTLTLPLIPSSQKIMTLDNAGNMAAPYTVDGSTITIASNVIGVPTGGITSAQILDGTIVNADISNTADINASKLLAGSIQNNNIANGVISGTKLVNGVDLPGLAAADGRIIVTQAALTTTGLKMVRGNVLVTTSSSISTINGEGFTTSVLSPTTYRITFTVPFTDAPAVIANATSPSYTISVINYAVNFFEISLTGAAGGSGVSFICMGLS